MNISKEEKLSLLRRLRDDNKMLSTMEGSDRLRYEKQAQILEECVTMMENKED